MKKIYMSQLLLLGVFLLFQSCQVQIMDNRRILISGTIVDNDNNPIPNISVRSQTHGEILGETVSDANGQFQYTSLESETNYPFDIMVNLKTYSSGWYGDNNSWLLENSNYSAKNYYNYSRNRNQSHYSLGAIQLSAPAQFSLFLNNIRGDNNTVSFKLEYETAICKIDLNIGDLENCYFEDESYRRLDQNTENFEINLESRLGTTLLFKYKLNNDPEQTISIPLTNPENSYVFEY